MTIIDSHIHFWEPDRPDRPWHKAGVNLGTPLSVEQLLADAQAAGVDKVLQVTPSIMGWDNTYGIEGAQKYPDRVVGVIGRFDPTAPNMPQRLRELKSQPKTYGVRITLISDWASWLVNGVLEDFFAEAGKQGVRVQIYGPHQATEILGAAKRHPQTTFLIDHMTLSHHDAEPFGDWLDVLTLSAASNVYMKASYFPEVAHEPYPFPTMQRYFKDLYERFGPDRLIWGSNYPPSAQACSYKENVEFTRNLPFLSESDKEKIFGQTLLRALGVSG
jgi:L-fuconolactonase